LDIKQHKCSKTQSRGHKIVLILGQFRRWVV